MSGVLPAGSARLGEMVGTSAGNLHAPRVYGAAGQTGNTTLEVREKIVALLPENEPAAVAHAV